MVGDGSKLGAVAPWHCLLWQYASHAMLHGKSVSHRAAGNRRATCKGRPARLIPREGFALPTHSSMAAGAAAGGRGGE
jgi:hypothetical protein